MERIDWLTIILLVAFSLAVFTLTVLWTVYGVVMTGNRVGTVLATLGVLITGLGFGVTIYANWGENKESALWKNESVFASHRQPSSISYPFRLEKPATINGEILGTSGPYEFFLTEFFGTEEEAIETTATTQTTSAVRPRVYVRGRGPDPQKSVIEPVSLSPGTYALRFGKHTSELSASFTLRQTTRIKPREHWYPLGQTLLQVGLPVLITGVISLAFGALV